MNVASTRLFTFLCLLLTCLSTWAKPIPGNWWEHWWFGDRNFGPDHGQVTIAETTKPGEYNVRMSVDRFQSCTVIGPRTCTVLDYEMSQVLSNWNFVFDKKHPAKAVLMLYDRDQHKSFWVPLTIAKPQWLSEKELQFKATFEKTLSPHLSDYVQQVIADGSQGEIASAMPLGLRDQVHLLNVDNDRKVPVGLLSAGLRYRLSKHVKIVKCRDAQGEIKYAHHCPSATQYLEAIAEANTSPRMLAGINYDPTQANPITGPDCTSDMNLNDSKKAQSWVVGQVKAISNTDKTLSMSTILTAEAGIPLTDDQIEAIARQYVLPCKPNIADPTRIPANVQVIKGILDQSKWDTLMAVAGQGETAKGNPAPVGLTYDNFLSAAGRMPYFCGEVGIYSSIGEACMRELATLFAHGAQETGTHDAVDGWKQPFYEVREGGCYNANSPCPQYDVPFPEYCPYNLRCNDGQQYYGRGAHQLTGWPNYFWFGSSYLGDGNVLLQHPDYVASNGYLALSSSIWFLMTAQPPKPSMHDVLIGNYKPNAAAGGITIDSNGTVSDKFMTTISIINGAKECTVSGQGQTQAEHRISYYYQLLNYLGATLNTVEQSYNTNNNGCSIANGDVFGNNASTLGYSTPLWLRRNWDWSQCVASKTVDSKPDSMMSAKPSWNICPKLDQVPRSLVAAADPKGGVKLTWVAPLKSSKSYTLEYSKEVDDQGTCNLVRPLNWQQVTSAISGTEYTYNPAGSLPVGAIYFRVTADSGGYTVTTYQSTQCAKAAQE